MHYQLFIPKGRGAAPSLLIDVGLADLVAGAEFFDAAQGPEGGPGSIVSWRKPGRVEFGYQPDKQLWLPAVPRGDLPGGRYWVGLWNGKEPTPEDLARPYRQMGAAVCLNGDTEWIIPQAKLLDADLRLADDGTWQFEVQRRFHEFYLTYTLWLERFANHSEGDQVSYAELADFVVDGLRLNYRILPEVVSAMGLLSKSTLVRAALTILGLKTGAAV